MNKNRKMKRKIAASVAVGMSVMMGVTPAFAASGTSDSDVYKEGKMRSINLKWGL